MGQRAQRTVLTNVPGHLAKALTADVQTVLADDAVTVATVAAGARARPILAWVTVVNLQEATVR
jgi:hypothetical protein